MKTLACIALAAICSAPMAQNAGTSSRRAVRIPVYHADPYFIKAMLEGQQVISPEISTLVLAAGGGQAAAQGAQQAVNSANAMFANGFFIVNPTDNSLWFFPNK